MTKLSIAACAGVLALLAGAAQAHHGWASYSDKEGQVAGVLESADLGAPHGLLKVRTADGMWDVMLAPPAGIQRAGLTLGDLPKGAKILAKGHKRIDGTREIKTERLTVGERTFDLYPNRD